MSRLKFHLLKENFVTGTFRQEFGSKLLNTVYNYLGFRSKVNDTHLDKYNRYNVLKYACQFGHAQCIADARHEYDELLRGNHT